MTASGFVPRPMAGACFFVHPAWAPAQVTLTSASTFRQFGAI